MLILLWHFIHVTNLLPNVAHHSTTVLLQCCCRCAWTGFEGLGWCRKLKTKPKPSFAEAVSDEEKSKSSLELTYTNSLLHCKYMNLKKWMEHCTVSVNHLCTVFDSKLCSLFGCWWNVFFFLLKVSSPWTQKNHWHNIVY